MTNERAIWLIWSNEHGKWWRPREAGYTFLIEQAGRYTRSRVDQIIRDSNYGGNINEMAVLAHEALDLIVADMPQAEALALGLIAEGAPKPGSKT
jgi:hypothetical protein